MNPRQRFLRRRRPVLQEQLHAAMADLMACGRNEDEMRRPFFGSDRARQRKEVGNAGPTFAHASVPAGHRRRDDDGRPRADLGDDVAAGDIALVMALDVQGHRRTRRKRPLECTARLGADHDHRHRPGRIFLRDVVGETVIRGIADRQQDGRRPLRHGLRDRRAMGRAEIGAAIERQIEQKDFSGDITVAGERRGEMKARFVHRRPPERRRLDRRAGHFGAGLLDDILPAKHDGLGPDLESGGLELSGDPVGGGAVAGRAEAMQAERGVARDVGVEARA